MMERVQKILSGRGVASRRQAEQMILAGRVTCNGRVCMLGERADPEVDEILLDGKPLPSGMMPIYIVLNKPRGYVTTLSDEKGRPNAAQLVAECGQRVYPVGRLDMDSEGLLLFTNDGEFANRLMHPSHEIEKVYQVWVRGYTPDAMEALKRPIVLDGYQIAVPKVVFLRNENTRTVLQVTIHEGRNRQVRRMCQYAGMEVTRLKRVSEGAIRLGTLKPGQWRYLTNEEIRALSKD